MAEHSGRDGSDGEAVLVTKDKYKLDPLAERVEEVSIEATLRRRVALALVVAVFLTAFMSFLTWRSRRLASVESDLVAHTYSVLQNLEGTLKDVINVESGARGFALTGDDHFLASYNAGRLAIPHDLAALHELLADNPIQQQRLDKLEPQVTKALLITRNIVAIRRNDGATLKATLIDNKQSVDAVRITVNEMEKEESRLVDQRTQSAKVSRQWTDRSLLFGTILGVGLLLLAGFTIHREIGVSARGRSQLKILNATLEQRVQQRTAALLSEVGERKKKDEQLQAGEERFRLLLEGVKDYAVYMLDSEGRVASWNIGAVRIKGYEAEEILGKHFSCFYPAEDQNSGKPQWELKEALARGRYEEQGVRIRKDGSTFWAHIVITPVYDAAGNLRGFSKVARDITDRKRVEDALGESEGRLASVIQSAMDSIITVDEDQRIVLFNAASEKMFRCPATEALGQPIARFIPQRFHSAHAGHIQKFGETGITNRTMGSRNALWAMRSNGEEFQIDAAISQIETGGKKLFTVILRDVTDRKRAETALANQAEELFQQAQELTRSQQALEAQTLMLKSVLNSIDEGLVVADEQGRFLVWNPAAERILGTTGARAANVPMVEWGSQGAHGPDGTTAMKTDELPLVRAIRGEDVDAEMAVWNSKQNQRVWIEITARPLRDTNGTMHGGVAAFRDITQKKESDQQLASQAEELSRQADELLRSRQALEAQTLMLQSVLDSIAEGLVAVNEEGKFVIWNPAAEKILGLGAANLRSEEWAAHYGFYLSDTVTPFPAGQLPLVRAIRGEVSTAQIFVRNRQLAEGIWIEASAGPMKDKDGIVRGGVVAFRDITQNRADELEIRNLNEDLERRVVGRTAQLEEANKELETFTYSVAHDLRAPLRHISSFSGILLEDTGPSLDAQAQHYLQRIQQGARKMGQLVDELLNLAKIGRQSANIRVTDLNSIVEEVIFMLQPEYVERKVEWKIAQLPLVECDSVLTRQIFQNLIANALKYSSPRSCAVIEIGHDHQDGQVVIFVRDNGVGFSMKYSDKLFGVFQRLHRVEDFEGTGVGLATVQRIIKKHGGRVWAEAEVDKGATFYFTLAGVKVAETLTKTIAARAN